MFKKKNFYTAVKSSKHDTAIKRGTTGNSLFRFDNIASASERMNEREREREMRREKEGKETTERRYDGGE